MDKKKLILRIVNIVLTIVAIYLGYALGKTLIEPVRAQKIAKQRYKEVIKRLEAVREAQMIYREIHKRFADDWDSLVYTIKYDTLIEVKVIGNPDDTTQEVTYDTLFIPAIQAYYERIGDNKVEPDSLPFIPFSGGKRFQLAAGFIEKGRVRVPVFQVVAPDTVFLADLPRDYVDEEHALILGSLREATYTGNWR